MPRYLAAALTAIALSWCLLLVAAPLALAGGAPAIAPAAASVYRAAGGICHQRPERSFRLAGIQLPVCARCLGLYAAGAAGALLAWTAIGARRRPSIDRMLLLTAALPTALTFTLEFIGVMPFSNGVRFVAALPLGIAAGWIFVGALRDEARQLSTPPLHIPR